MSTDQPKIRGIHRAGTISLVVGIFGVLLAAVGYFTDGRTQFLQSYLQAYIFWAAIPLGSLGWLLIHHLAGGGWGFSARRIFEAAVRTLPLVALLLVPVLLGMDALYAKWLHPEDVESMVPFLELIQQKSLYLNRGFFILRNIIYFAAWIALGTVLCRWSIRQDHNGDETLNIPMRTLSGIGIVVFSLLLTLASWDWTMSLEPTWFSSMWGPLFFAGSALSAVAFAIVVLAPLSRTEPMRNFVQPRYFHDLGNWTFAFTILWTYMTFSQFIIIWSGNLPEETSWYLVRTASGWKTTAVILTIFNFLVPFLVLLSRFNKLRVKLLARIALYVLIMRLVDIYWVVAPSFHKDVDLSLSDAALPLAVGGLWLAFFFNRLGRHALLPQHDPRFPLDTMRQEAEQAHG